MTWARYLATPVVLAVATLTLAAQQPTFKAGTQLVPVFVTVTDAEKRLVPGLVKEDFEVLDNGKPTPIVLFDAEVQPITVVVMLDTSGSMTGSLDLLRAAAEQFLIRLLPADKAAGGRVQRQDPVRRHVQLEPRRPGRLAARSRLRQPDAPLRRDRRVARSAARQGRAGAPSWCSPTAKTRSARPRWVACSSARAPRK